MDNTILLNSPKKESEKKYSTKIQVKSLHKEEFKNTMSQKVRKYEDGFWKVVFDEESKDHIKVQRLSSSIDILFMTRAEDSSSWGVFLQWYDPDQKIHTWPMPLDLLNKPGGEWLSHLQSNGFSITPEGVPFLKEFLASAEDYTKKRARLATKTGWSEDAKTFALPHKNLGADQAEQVVMQQNPGTAKMYRESGTLEEWKHEVAEKSVGNSRLTFMMCAALTGPMLYLTGGESGGFHIVGESSKGKSTALRLAASIWGDQGGHFKSWRTTDNAAESLAVFSNDTCLILDEIGEAPAKACSDLAYMLANGTGKSRAGRDGLAKAAQTWRTTFLSSGEITLSQKLSEVDKKLRAGQAVRIAEISADAGRGMGVFEDCHGMKPSDFAVKIKDASRDFYGTAGPAFVDALIKTDEISKKIKLLSEDFAKIACEEKADGQVLRVATRFGMCLAAGKIAVEHGIFPHKVEHIETAVKKCFESWLEMRGGQGAGEDKEIVKTIKLFIEMHGQSRFQNLHPRTDAEGNEIEQLCLNRCGFRSSDEYYVLEEAWEHEIFKKINFKKAAKVLLKEGILECQEQEGRIKTKKSFPGVGKVRCYVIRINDEKTSQLKKAITEKETYTSPIVEQGVLMDGKAAEEFCAEIINGMAV